MSETKPVKPAEAVTSKAVKTVVIDTADRAFALCMNHICEKMSISYPAEKEHGIGWHMLRQEWERVIQKLNMMNCGLVLICHETTKEITRKHVKIDRYQPDIPKTGYDIVYDLSDILLHYSYHDDDTRVLYARATEDRIAGCRGGLLPPTVEPTFKAINAAIKEHTGKTYEDVLPVVTIYGSPKIGKSTIASEFPGAIFADFENGLKFLDVESHLIKSWNGGEKDSFLTFCKNL